ncbi:CPK2, partial [Symbiodinium sp. KB8]
MGGTASAPLGSTDLPPGDPAAFQVAPDAKISDMHVIPKARRGRKLTDHYRIPQADELGRGHYGVVRIGTRIIDGKKFAVKTIVKKRPLYVLMLRNEIRILEGLQHPYIIQMVDAFEEPDVVHLIFELAPGGELFEPIADTKFWFDEQMASRVMRQSLEGLRYLHERNIVHRDLKPENILLVSKDYPNSTLKVIDFGLATQYDPADPPLRKHVGTPYYIAPEVLHKQYRESADVWSMGVIMFTIMCAYPPFWGNTEADIYSRIRKGMYRFQGAEWQRRSDDAKDMVRSLLQLDPAKRLNVHTALQHPWIVYEGEPHLPPTSPRIVSLLRTWTSFPWLKRLHILLVAARWVRKAETVPRENQLWAGLTGSKDAKEITLGSLHDALQRIALQHPPSAVSISPPVMGSEVTGRAVQGQEQGDDRQNLSTWPEGDPPHCAWPRPPSSELGRLMAKLDTGACGAVSKAEFMAWACPRTQYLDSKNIIHSFKQLDVDGDGLISADDLVAVAHRLPTFTGITPHRPYSLEHYVYHIVQEASLLPPAISLQGMPMPDWQEGVPADMDAE